MNRVARTLLIVLLVLSFAAPVRQGQAQPLECGADDRECLSDGWAQACGRTGTEESCLAWAQRLEAHVLAENPEWKLFAATGYSRAADFSDLREEEERYQEQSRSILYEMLAAWPDGFYAAQAYLGLAMLTDDIDESIALQREAVRADPSRANILWGLARWLVTRGRFEDLSEAADLYRRSYLAWAGYATAWDALSLYERTGQTEQAEEFRAQVARDSGMADFPEEVVSAGFSQDLERATEVLETACRRYIVTIFGPDTCSNGIDTLVAATRSAQSLAARRSIVDVATEAMRMLTVSGTGTVDERTQRRYEFASIYREWIETGAATASAYVRWALHPESDFEESVAAFERAVELAPDNGRYRYWLAQGYIEQDRFDEAIEHLTLARETLPDNVGITPESVDREISRAELGRISRPLSPASP